MAAIWLARAGVRGSWRRAGARPCSSVSHSLVAGSSLWWACWSRWCCQRRAAVAFWGGPVGRLAQQVVNERPLDEQPGQDLRYRLAGHVPSEVLHEDHPTEQPPPVHHEPPWGMTPPRLSPDEHPDQSFGPAR